MPSNDMRDTMLASAERDRQISFEERLAQRRQELAGEQAAEASGANEPAQGADIGLTMPAGMPDTPAGTPSPEEEGGILQTAGAVGSDIAAGLTREMPFAMANGVIRSFNETIDFAESASEAVARLTPEGTPEAIRTLVENFPLTAPLARVSGEGQDLPDVPELPQPQTTTGQIVQGASQFISGFLGAGKITKTANILQGSSILVRGARAYLNGAIADLTVFDEHEERLSNLIQSVPGLQNPVTEYLAASEEDSALEGRIKNVLEGGALGMVADSIVGGIRAIRAARNAVREVDDSLAFLDRADGEAAAAIERDVFRNGTPDQPAVAVSGPRRMEEQLDLINQADEAAGRTAPPDTTTARPFEADASERRTPVHPQYRQDIGNFSDRVWHETSPDSALTLMPQSNLFSELGDIYVSDIPDLALGQGGNRGVLLEFDTGGMQGNLNLSKPTSRANFTEGLGSEFIVRDGSSRRLARNLRALRVSDDATLSTRFLATLDRLERDGWQRQPGDGFTDYIRPPSSGGDARVGTLSGEEAERVVSGIAVPGYTLSDGREMRINFNALNTEEDIQAAIGNMADLFSGELEATRRGVRGDAVVINDAATMSAWDALNSRRVGQPLSDSEVYAAQSLYVTSGANVRDAVEHALANPDSTAAQFAAKRAVTIHRAIQAEIAGAKADAGRALRAWGMSAEANASVRREMENIIDLNGGRMSEKDLVRLREIAGDPSRLDQVSRRGFHPATEIMSEWIRFAFLGNPVTQVANLVGNTFAIAYDTLPRLGAGVQGMLFDDPALTRELRTVLDEYAGLAAGARAQFANFARTADYARMGRSLAEAAQRPTLKGKLMGTASALARDNPLSATFRGRFDDFGAGGQKFVDTQRSGRALSAETAGARADSIWGQFLNSSGAVMAAPQEFLGFADDFFKGINVYSTLHTRAARQARQELGEGASKADFVARVRQLIEEPSDEWLEEGINIARRRTFTEPIGKNTRALLNLRNTMNSFGFPLGSLLMPFVVTPSNILKFAFRNSPAGVFWKDLWDDINAGGVRAATARSRIASGTVLAFVGMDMVANGDLTGRLPEDPGERERWERMGIQPYSLRTPWGWMSYRRMEPVSTMLAIGADTQMVMQNGYENTDEPLDIADQFGPILGAAIQVVSDKSYLTGISEFIQFAQDPNRYGPTYARNLLSSVIVPSAVFQAERLSDPVMRDNSTIMNRIMGSVPGFSDSVPPRRDLWGRVRRVESRLGEFYDALSPWAIRANDQEPIDTELSRLGDAPSMPSWTISVRGSVGVSAPVNLRHRPDIYWRYVELAGNEAPSMPGRMGLRDYLNAVVSGNHRDSAAYERLPDDPSAPVSKASFIRDRIQDAREVARMMIEREYRHELRAMADASLVRQTEQQARREQVFEETGR